MKNTLGRAKAENQNSCATKKVRMMLALNGDGGSEIWEGGINGRFFRIKRGETVEAPQNVADMIRLNEMTRAAGQAQIQRFRRMEAFNEEGRES